jgi:hypothetical protein
MTIIGASEIFGQMYILTFHTITTVHFYESNQINRPTNALFDNFNVVSLLYNLHVFRT